MLNITQPAPLERITTLGALTTGDLFVYVHTGGIGHGVFSREIMQVGPAPEEWERAFHLVNTIRPDGQDSNQFTFCTVVHLTPEEAAAIRTQVAAFDAMPTR